MRNSIFIVSVLSCLMGSTAYAQSVPRGVSTDHRVKLVNFNPNDIVVLKGRYGYQTEIKFAENEVVQSVSLGDSLAWQAVPVSNHLFIKPVIASKTNMSVLTNLNNYNFQLDSLDETASPTYLLQFTYKEGGYNEGGTPNAVATFDPEKINWKYSFTGMRALAPVEAFDNGQFTYFKFKNEGMSHLPAIFIVGKDRDETLVNYHMQGDYVVIHSTAMQFTLRDGSNVTSVYNDFAIGDWKKV